MLKKGRVGKGKTEREKNKSAESLSTALEDLTQHLGISKKLTQYSVLTSWKTIVGEKIARVTEAERIENGILFVKTLNAPWRAELTMRRREILEQIHAAVGADIVQDIRFR